MEIWKKIPGFDFYEASNLGRVRSITRTISQLQPRYGDMIIERHFKSKVLNQSVLSDKGKYPHYVVTICRDAIKYKSLVHRLVLIAFKGECPKGMQCCHNDGNGLNNVLENLRWDTPSSNQLDRHKHGTHWTPINKGSSHPRAILNEEKVQSIRKAKREGKSSKELAEKFQINISTIQNVASRRSWKHL